MTLQETRDFFGGFHCEILSSSIQNKIDIQNFSCKIRGNTLEHFFRNEAWKVDSNGETRIYIIREPNNRDIVLYFSLKCSTLFTSYPLDDEYDVLSSSEKTMVDEMIGYRQSGNLNEYYQLVQAIKPVKDEKKLSLLLRIVEHKTNKKKELEQIDDSKNVLLVNNCYSSIEIQHFCRSDKYTVKPLIKCPLGFGLFWEKIVPIVQSIAQSIGCEYLYLFAADRSDNPEDKNLISYYKDSLCFREVAQEDVIALKPDYDRNCVGLLQTISGLEEMKRYAWESYSDSVDP